MPAAVGASAIGRGCLVAGWQQLDVPLRGHAILSSCYEFALLVNQIYLLSYCIAFAAAAYGLGEHNTDNCTAGERVYGRTVDTEVRAGA